MVGRYTGYMRQRQAFMYTCLWGSLLLFGGVACLLSVGAWGEAWQQTRARQAIETTFQSQYARWQAQDIRHYEVRYGSCSAGRCCEDALLRVQSRLQVQYRHTCGANTLQGYYGSWDFSSVDQLYRRLEDWMRFNPHRPIEIEYDPSLHYIRRVSFRPSSAQASITLTYDDLQPVSP